MNILVLLLLIYLVAGLPAGPWWQGACPYGYGVYGGGGGIILLIIAVLLVTRSP